MLIMTRNLSRQQPGIGKTGLNLVEQIKTLVREIETSKKIEAYVPVGLRK
jgi:hypothetical protein